MDPIPYYIFKIILSILSKNMKNWLIKNLPIRISVNKIENRITYETKTWYYLELLTPETMKLFGSTKHKMPKDKIGKNYWSSISSL